MDYVFDTDHISFVLKRHPKVTRRIESAAGASFHIPVAAMAEVLAGIERMPAGKRRGDLTLAFRNLVRETGSILPATSVTAESYASIHAAVAQIGRPIPTNDIWIAAIARERGATLLSRDAHFRAVPGLVVEDWSAPT